MTDAPYNPSSPAQVKQRKRKADLAVERDVADLRAVMATAQGRRLVWRWLGGAYVFRSTFAVVDAQTNFNEGMRNVGLGMLDELMKHCPDAYLQMQAEALAER